MATKEEIVNEAKKQGRYSHEGESLYYDRRDYAENHSAEETIRRSDHPTIFESILDIFTGR